MDKKFLERYNQELAYFREASQEFADEHPQVAKRLGLAAPEIEDPYVERLIESVSFLTARVNLKIDAEYPNFVQHIFKVILPEFTQPVPSASIVAIDPANYESTFIPKHTLLSTFAKKNGEATCQFSSCFGLQLLPTRIQNTLYSKTSEKIGSDHINKSFFTFTLDVNFPVGENIDNVDFDAVRFFMQGNDLLVNSEMLYYLHTHATGLQVELEDNPVNWSKNYEPKIQLAGFDHYLNIYNDRTADYIQHLLEYGIFPEKYLFFKLENLADILKDQQLKELMIVEGAEEVTIKSYRLRFTFSFKEFSNTLETHVDNNILSMNSVLINNAFKRRTRIEIDERKNEQHVVINNKRPNDYEILCIEKVEGYSNFNHKVKTYEPIYKLNNNTDQFNSDSYGFFSEINKKNRSLAPATSYKGNECYVMLTNQIKHMQEDDLSQLSVVTWCSNRALPSKINWTLDQDLTILDSKFDIARVKRQASFTQPLDMPIENTSLWRLMNVISSNFIPLEIDNNEGLTQQIKNNLFVIYDIIKSDAFKNQINAIMDISATKTSKVKKIGYRLAPFNGLKFNVVIDDMLMSHVHPFLWGSVLLSYFKGFAPLNHYVDLNLLNKKEEVIATFTSSP